MHYDDAKFTSAPSRTAQGQTRPDPDPDPIRTTRRWGVAAGRVCRIGGGVCDAFNANKLCYALCKII